MMYEHELVSQEGTIINKIQEEGTSVKILRKRQYPHIRYPKCDLVAIPKLRGKNHLT